MKKISKTAKNPYKLYQSAFAAGNRRVPKNKPRGSDRELQVYTSSPERVKGGGRQNI
jgi:hypothetical protein